MAEYIDKQAAIDEMRERQLSANEWYTTAKAKDDEEIMVRADSAIACFIECILTLKKMPSADVQQVRHGKWEERKVSDKNCIDEWQTACCSVCHKYHTTPYMYYFDNYNYCPNCGARMDGEQDVHSK